MQDSSYIENDFIKKLKEIIERETQLVEALSKTNPACKKLLPKYQEEKYFKKSFDVLLTKLSCLTLESPTIILTSMFFHLA